MENENSNFLVFLYFDPCSRMIYKFPLIWTTDIEHIKFEILIEELGSSTVWFRGAKYENTDELLRFISKENEKTRGETCRRTQSRNDGNGRERVTR